MTKEEIETELGNAEKNLTEGKDLASSLLNGTEENYLDLKKQADDAYKNYQDELKVLDEDMAKELDTYSKKASTGRDVNEDFLLDINQLQDNTMLVRENIVDKQRMISAILKSDKFPRDVYTKLGVINKDIGSLINHTNFSFERLDYLLNTVVGLINLEQNRIMKVFTLVSLLLMPPTLIASIYGMNIKLPFMESNSAFLILIGIMLVSIVITLVVFKKRKML